MACNRSFLLTGLLLAFTFSEAHGQVDLGDVTEKHVMIPMRDGTKLSAYLYFPAGKGPWPVLYEQRYADLRGVETRKTNARLASAGYVVAAQNFRGTYLSEGTWVGYRALGWGEKKDGYDTVEWLAQQPWCTGKIGTLGSSQAGFAQNFLAVTRPPHLVCQYMIDTGLSLYHEGYRIGGTTRPERFKQMDAVCRVPEDNRRLLRDWFAHPTYDAYWADEDCTPHFAKMDVPCFTIGSWYDFMSVGSIDSYVGRQHHGSPGSRGKQQLILGPWLHGRNKEVNKVGDLTYPINARFAMEAHMIRWFDHYLKGKNNDMNRDPAVRYYVMGALGEKDAPGNVWRTAADWPIAATNVPYYLRSNGKLATQPPTEETAQTAFDADPLHPNEIPSRAFPGARDARPFEKQGEVRTFTSEVLAAPVEWTGKVRAELYVTSTASDTDFIVRVSDVYPDGRSILLMDYVRRARYREGYEKEVFLEAGKVTKIAFDVGSTSQIFNRGHRIRITMASTGAPFYEPNPNTGLPLSIEAPKKTQVAHNTVQHDRRYASRILAPVLEQADGKSGAVNWERFRGPNGTGTSNDKNIPVKFGANENVIWKVDLTGSGNSSPIIWGKHLFLHSASKDGKQRSLLCLDTADGKIRWKKSIAAQPARIRFDSSLASSTPTTDGKAVYVSFWNGKEIVLSAYDFQGEKLWSKNLGKFNSQHGPGASPILVDDKLILANDMDKDDFTTKVPNVRPSMLMAFDKRTGRLLWEAARTAERACYSAPFLLHRTGAKQPELVVTNTMAVTGYNVASGVKLWEVKGWQKHAVKAPMRTVASSTLAGDILCVCSGGDGGRYAMALDLGSIEKAGTPRRIWENRKDFPYVPSPLAHGDHIYFVNDAGFAGCYQSRTGKRLWFDRISDTGFHSSPLLIDGKIYATNTAGDVFVFAAEPSYRLLARNELGEVVRATAAVADGRLYIRGEKHLFCIGTKK